MAETWYVVAYNLLEFDVGQSSNSENESGQHSAQKLAGKVCSVFNNSLDRVFSDLAEIWYLVALWNPAGENL